MKKVIKLIAVLLIVICCSFVFYGCNKNKTKFYEKYFNNFTSQAPFTKATSRLNLDNGVGVFSYDSTNGVFVTKKYVSNQYAVSQDDSTMTLFGFASIDTVYVNPTYTNILSIKGDYAIVTKPFYNQSASELIEIIGVVKFRGENAGDRTDFTDINCIYNAAYNQFTFVGENYIAVPGIKSYPTAVTNFTTFYDYKTKDKLLETFKVGCDYNYSMVMYDEILVAVSKSGAYFFDIHDVLQNGFLAVGDYNYYKAFPEDTQNQYNDYISIQVNYIGNGWFVRTARLESETEFTGYNLMYDSYDAGTGVDTVIYATVRSDMFNFYTKNTRDNDWLLVDSVANEYSLAAYTYSADAINNLAVAENERYVYYMPVLNPATFIKDGYSIVYFYYLPYIDDGNYFYEISFCIIDDSANIVRLEDALMPLAFTDGIGIQNIDPTYESLFGNLQYITYNNEKINLLEISIGVNTYETFFAHNGIIIGTEYNFSNSTVYYGAVDAKSKKMVLPFIYSELTPFYGNNAIGMRVFENANAYFKIDNEGKETMLSDVVNVRHGVYVYASSGKLGVKNYAGDVLVDAVYDSLEVYDVFNSGNAFQKSFVIATSGSYTYISTLE